MTKINIIGAGRIGGLTAYSLLFMAENLDIVLTDINHDLAQAQQMELNNVANENRCKNNKVSVSFEPVKDANLYVITAGFPRTGNMEKVHMLNKNKPIVDEIIAKIDGHKKILVATNPPEEICKGYDRRVMPFGKEVDQARADYLKIGKVYGTHAEYWVEPKENTKLLKDFNNEIMEKKGWTEFLPAYKLAERILYEIEKDDIKKELQEEARLPNPDHIKRKEASK